MSRLAVLHLMHSQRVNVLASISVVGLGLVIGLLSGQLGSPALLVAGLIIPAVAVLRQPVIAGVVVLPASFLTQRLSGGAGGNGVSIADAVLALAALVSIPAVVGTAELRRAAKGLQPVAIYLAAIGIGVVAHPSSRTIFEWGHRLSILAGSIAVGVWVAREGRIKLALRLLLLAGSVVAVAAMVTTLRHGLSPAFPLGLHKNFAGPMLAMCALVVIASPGEAGLPTVTRGPAVALFGLGVLATQSRGAALFLATGFVIFAFSGSLSAGGANGRRLLAIGLATGLALFAYVSVSDQVTDQNRATNSVGVREKVEARAREIWRTSPELGVGLKYFNTGTYGALAQPANNVVDNELAESGVLGLLGFLWLQVSVLLSLRRLRTPLGLLALAAVAGRLVHGQVDIYWAAGVTPLVFVLVGVAFGSHRSSLRSPGSRPSSKLGRG